MKLEEALELMKQAFAFQISTMGSTKFNDVLKTAGQLQEVAKVLEEHTATKKEEKEDEPTEG